ncbi:MAG: bifunctional pyr operon transcriptional regulator/uracil phosphoribosyltransferase PyrR [Rhodocyclaceae bacterium]|nr:bifunctional pyr operon transcriptional regulator/uracil phosphoribosyltransferase PyrR [Rhodocyclaceae bacterium]
MPIDLPNAESLLARLIEQIRPDVTPRTALVGIHTGGAWLAERLHRSLGIQASLGTIDVSFYRDDYGSKGLHAKPQRSDIPFDVENADIIIVDDVLYTGRTTRAALNELFDYGRPARVDLAVLCDRHGRELPISARYCAHTLDEPLAASRILRLSQDATGTLSLRLIDA